jgi:ABC-2 type transport system permease protein
MELKRTVAYPASFWIIALTIPLYSIIQIVFLETIYSQTSNFAGYTKYEAYVLFGTFEIVQTLGHIFFHLRLADLKGLIRGGSQDSLDNVLTKPIDAQISATLGRFNFGNIAPFFIAIFIVLYGLTNEPHLLNVLNIASYLILVVMGTFIFYLTFLFISTLLFWYPELQMAEALWESFQSLGQYPSGLYHGVVGVIFNLVIPITLMASIPVEFLLGDKSPVMLLLYIGIVVVLFLATRLFWTTAIKKYSSFSS